MISRIACPAYIDATISSAYEGGVALDDRERRHLRWVAGFALLGLVVFTAGMNVTLARRDPAFMIAGYAYMQLSFFILYGYAMPRVRLTPTAREVGWNVAVHRERARNEIGFSPRRPPTRRV